MREVEGFEILRLEYSKSICLSNLFLFFLKRLERCGMLIVPIPGKHPLSYSVKFLAWGLLYAGAIQIEVWANEYLCLNRHPKK